MCLGACRLQSNSQTHLIVNTIPVHMVELKFTFGLKLLGLTVAVLIFFIIASLCINMVSPNDGGRTRFIACNKPSDTYCMGLEGCLH